MRLLFICLLAIGCGGQNTGSPPLLIGQLDPDFTTSEAQKAMLETASDPRAVLPADLAVSEGDHVFTGQLPLRPVVGLIRGGKIKVVLVARKAASPWLVADVDLNGVLSASERFTFQPSADPRYSQRVVLRVQLPGPPPRLQPVVVQLPRPQATVSSELEVVLSLGAVVRGAVDIGGQRTLVELPFDLLQDTPNIRQGYIRVDANGDGKLDRTLLSTEEALARNERVVFRVGQHYVSVESADMTARRLTLREHPPSDYERIELSLNSELPDFQFTDLDGRARSLREFRGKLVLIAYWSPMCGWSVQEIPRVKHAYENNRGRGLEILGLLPSDQKLEDLKAFVAKEGIAWPNATPDSVRDLVDHRLRLLEEPTLLLLDDKGRILSRGKEGEPGLRGAELEKTLARFLPASSAQ